MAEGHDPRISDEDVETNDHRHSDQHFGECCGHRLQPLNVPTPTMMLRMQASVNTVPCWPSLRSRIINFATLSLLDPFKNVLCRDEAGGPDQQHKDDDQEGKRVSERTQFRRQVSLEHRDEEADKETPGNRSLQTSHASDYDCDESEERGGTPMVWLRVPDCVT